MRAYRQPWFNSFLLLGLLGLNSSQALAGSACDLTVGPDPACSHSNLNAAVFTAAFTASPEVICVAQNNDETNVNISLINFDNPLPGTGSGALTIDGGYQTCASVSPNNSREALAGGASNSVITVNAAPGRSSNVVLRRLRLTGGSMGLNAGMGANVTVDSAKFDFNGQGINLSAGANVTLDANSSVHDNDGANMGGGIHCSNATLTTAAEVYNNDGDMDSQGGGLYANNCTVQLNDGAWFRNNSAQEGGGIYFALSHVRGGGTGGLGVQVFANTADRGIFGYGGGIYSAKGSDVLLANIKIQDNHASVRGGGIYIASSIFQLERFNFESCVLPNRCTVISDNTSPVLGAAVYLTAGSGSSASFRMYQGFMERNRVPDGAAGTLVHGKGTNVSVYMEGVQVFDNQVKHPFTAEDGAEMTLGNLTVAGNYWVNSLDNRLKANGARTSGTSVPEINIFSSIWADHLAFEGDVRADCLMAETNEGLASASRSQFGATDPGFIDKDSGDLHLSTDSPALDYCDNVNFNSVDSDYDIDTRGIDLPTVANLHGPYDLGADEATMGPPAPSGPIFSDGFESPP